MRLCVFWLFSVATDDKLAFPTVQFSYIVSLFNICKRACRARKKKKAANAF